jgi:integrase
MPDKLDTTHVITENELIVYRRENSSIWQCRFKVDGNWQRASTKERNLQSAKEKAKDLHLEAKIRQREGLPVLSRKFRNVANMAVKRLKDEIASGNGKVIYKDYIRVINDYLIPALGKRNIANIDRAALDELDAFRIEKMQKTPTASTLQTQNAALQRVFEEAIIHGYLTKANCPKLSKRNSKSKNTGQPRVAFELEEVRTLLDSFEPWIDKSRDGKSKELRELLRDYVEVLLDTGARPGKELLNLQWNQVKTRRKPVSTPSGTYDEDDDGVFEVMDTNLNRSLEMTVSGKTGTRTIVGMQPSYSALARIAKRNYSVHSPAIDPLSSLTTPDNDDFVFRTSSSQDEPKSFQKLFQKFLTDHDLLIDPITGKKRVFYSLRHTYATLRLVHDNISIHTLAKQMGTSVTMIEKHYSHLDAVKAVDQLRSEETRKLIHGGSISEKAHTEM